MFCVFSWCVFCWCSGGKLKWSFALVRWFFRFGFFLGLADWRPKGVELHPVYDLAERFRSDLGGFFGFKSAIEDRHMLGVHPLNQGFLLDVALFPADITLFLVLPVIVFRSEE